MTEITKKRRKTKVRAKNTGSSISKKAEIALCKITKKMLNPNKI